MHCAYTIRDGQSALLFVTPFGGVNIPVLVWQCNVGERRRLYSVELWTFGLIVGSVAASAVSLLYCVVRSFAV